MKAVRVTVSALVAVVLLGGAPAGARDGDPAAAERQYRIARRLAAEGSPEARDALEKVIELDPAGDLADDAKVDLAWLDSPPEWPDLIGRLDAARAARALQLLDDVVRRHGKGDRIHEALYLRALLRLEPLATYDPSAALVDLTAVASVDSTWSTRARLARAWLQESQGHEARAFDAYQRLLVDVPRDPAAVRARIGLGRVLLRRGEFGKGACRLQEAIEEEPPGGSEALTLRELAVRLLLRQAGATDPAPPVRVRTGVRAPAGFAPTAAGGLLLGDRKRKVVVELDRAGVRTEEWVLESLDTVVVDPRGRRFAAAGETLFRLDDAGTVTPVAALGALAPVGRIAADLAGGFWLLDRRGKSVGRIEPGADRPVAWWESDGGRLLALAWDGSRLLAIDGRQRTVVELVRNVPSRLLTERDSARPVDIAVDPAGRAAVLDGRTGVVRFLHAAAGPDPVGFASPEVPRPTAVGLGPEGELHLLDADGDWVVFR